MKSLISWWTALQCFAWGALAVTAFFVPVTPLLVAFLATWRAIETAIRPIDRDYEREMARVRALREAATTVSAMASEEADRGKALALRNASCEVYNLTIKEPPS